MGMSVQNQRHRQLPLQNRCGKYKTKKLIWDNLHHSLIMFSWVALKDHVKHAKILLTITEPCLNPEFPQEQRKKYQTPNN